jgi:hypothetical protein
MPGPSFSSYPTDWLKEKFLPETHGFLPSSIGVSGFNFPIIQFYESYVSYTEKNPLFWTHFIMLHQPNNLKIPQQPILYNSNPQKSNQTSNPTILVMWQTQD